MRVAGAAVRANVEFAPGVTELAHAAAVDPHDRERVHVVRAQTDPAAVPSRRNRDLPFVPGDLQFGQRAATPRRVTEDHLRILLDVAPDAGPTARDLEETPLARRRRPFPRLGGLPAPKSVQADPLARGRGLAVGGSGIPDRGDPSRQRRREGAVRCRRNGGERQEAREPPRAHAVKGTMDARKIHGCLRLPCLAPGGAAGGGSVRARRPFSSAWRSQRAASARTRSGSAAARSRCSPRSRAKS